MHVAHCDRTSERRKEKRNRKNVSVKIPQKLSAATSSSVHQRMVHLSTVLLLSGFLCPSPSPPTLMTHTSPPNFLLKKIKEKTGKKKMAMTRGQTASHYHNSGTHITVPLRLIQRSSRRTSRNLQRSNRNITLSNPPTLYMETDGNKKLIEEHPAPPPPQPTSPTPSSPTQPQEDCVRVTPGHQRSHKVSIKEPLTGGSLVFHSWNELLGLWVQAALALRKKRDEVHISTISQKFI